MTKIAVLDDYQNVAQMLGPWDRLGNDVQLTADLRPEKSCCLEHGCHPTAVMSTPVTGSASVGRPRKARGLAQRNPGAPSDAGGLSRKRLKGLEPSTFCMANGRIEARFSVGRESPYGTGHFSMVAEGGFGTRSGTQQL
jgi:hypothetical protein